MRPAASPAVRTPGGAVMASQIETPPRPQAANHRTPAAGPDVATAAHQAFWLLRIGFTAAPILFGLDKFFDWSVHWPDYLAGWVDDIVPGSGQDFMYAVGVVEIAAGLL